MTLTANQRQERARAEGYIRLLGPMPCSVCGGVMLPATSEEDVGWQCLMCNRERMWRVTPDCGFAHLRPSLQCRKLTNDEVRRIHQRFEEDTKQIDIVREFGINRQSVVGLKTRWAAEQAGRVLTTCTNQPGSPD